MDAGSTNRVEQPDRNLTHSGEAGGGGGDIHLTILPDTAIRTSPEKTFELFPSYRREHCDRQDNDLATLSFD